MLAHRMIRRSLPLSEHGHEAQIDLRQDAPEIQKLSVLAALFELAPAT